MPRRPITRAELERLISDLAESLGWLHHHARCPGRTRDGYIDGFPSEVLVRDNRLLLLTITGARGELSPPESGWATALARVGAVESHVIGPPDLRALTDLLRRPTPRGNGSPGAFGEKRRDMSV